jgi:hypothetical protein
MFHVPSLPKSRMYLSHSQVLVAETENVFLLASDPTQSPDVESTNHPFCPLAASP